MKIITNPISIKELAELAENKFGNFIKAVIDIERNIMAVDAELHADEEALLIENGSHSNNLWGINLYPNKKGEEFIEFSSMINIKPRLGNRNRDINDSAVKNKIIEIVGKLVSE